MSSLVLSQHWESWACPNAGTPLSPPQWINLPAIRGVRLLGSEYNPSPTGHHICRGHRSHSSEHPIESPFMALGVKGRLGTLSSKKSSLKSSLELHGFSPGFKVTTGVLDHPMWKTVTCKVMCLSFSISYLLPWSHLAIQQAIALVILIGPGMLGQPTK